MKLSLFYITMALLVACENTQVHTFSGKTMGTTYTVKYVADTASVGIEGSVDDVLKRTNMLMSTYDPKSQISQFNLHGTSLFPIDPWFAEVVGFSLRLAKESQGRYDPTIGPLVNLWGFGWSDQKKTSPSSQDLAATRQRVGYEKVSLQMIKGEWFLKKDRPDVSLDLSSTAKGFGVDKVSEALLAAGITDFLVEVGGEMKSHGTKGKESWRIAIEAPTVEKRSIQKVIPLVHSAIATSGNYRNFFQEDGKVQSHIINGKKGRPVYHNLASVSVLASSAMEADGYATLLMVLGPENAKAFAEDNQISAFFITTDPEKQLFDVAKSRPFEQHMKRVEGF